MTRSGAFTNVIDTYDDAGWRLFASRELNALGSSATQLIAQTAVTSDGALWFPLGRGGTMEYFGRIDKDESFSELVAPCYAVVTSLAATDDGALWYNSAGFPQVTRIADP